MRVNSIAKISSGLVIARKKAVIISQAIKEYRQLNLRAIHKKGYILLEELEVLPAKEQIDSDYITHEGDIVVRLTDPFTAVYITQEYEGIVVSSNFCIIRDVGKVDMGFLSFYLNSDAVKKQLLSNQQGSIMKNINISDIEKIDVPNIPLEKQQIYKKVLLSEIEQIKILERLQVLESNMIDKILKSMTEKMRGEVR